MNVGPVARAQGAITAFQSSLGEIVCQVAEQQERAEHAEERAREAEALVRELQRDMTQAGMERRLREEYRRGYQAGHAARGRLKVVDAA